MKKSGFTLVEMLAVIAVLGILVLLVLPNVLKNYRDAKKIAFLDEAKVVYTKATDKYVLKRTQGEKVGLITNDSNKLDLNNAEDLEYTVRIDSEGQVTSFRLKNNEFCIVGVGDFLNTYEIKDIIDLSEEDGSERCVTTNLIDNTIYTLKLLSRVSTTTDYDPKTIFLKYNAGWYKEKTARSKLDTNSNGEPMVIKPYLKNHYFKGSWATNMNGIKIKAIECDGTVVAGIDGGGIFTGNENTPYVNAFSEFSQKYYQVAYFGGDNSTGNISTLKVLYGEEKRLPKNKDANGYGINIKKTGYLFTGWKSNNVFYEDGALLPVITDDNENDTKNVYYKFNNESVCSDNLEVENTNIKTFEAEWQPVVYSVKYDCNNGTGNMANSMHTYDIAKNLSKNVCSRTGYTHKGWATTNSATTAVFNDEQSIVNLTDIDGAVVTLYAVWKDEEKPTCTVTKSNTNSTAGVTTTVTCSDTGSGCKSTNPTGDTGLKSNKTYTVYDNVGNSNTCSVTVTSQLQSNTCAKYNSCATSACGTKTCAHSSCGCSKYKSCANYACGTCGGESYACNTVCEWCGANGCHTSPSCPPSGWCSCSSKTCYKPTYACTCRTEACGCESYKTCQTSGCGYYSCATSVCGCASWGGWVNASSCSASSNTKQCRTIYK